MKHNLFNLDISRAPQILECYIRYIYSTVKQYCCTMKLDILPYFNSILYIKNTNEDMTTMDTALLVFFYIKNTN
jgi:hypothetical protein